MNRREFLKNSLMGSTTIVALPAAITGCSEGSATEPDDNSACDLSPRETAGPFPIKTPADLVRANIVSDRTGVALLIALTVLDQSNDCQPLANVYVDLWHCDKDGYYSEYGNIQGQQQDFTNAHFLRGRQLTDANGQVSFISIYPGWYPGRAPHLHIEVLDQNEDSIRVTQIAFPEDISKIVYATAGYNGTFDTSNIRDGVFLDSLEANMADSVAGNTTDGYTLLKTIIV